MNSSHFLLFANSVLLLHILIVGFVIFGLLLFLLGGILGWGWVRNPWLRFAHLACIAVVTLQAWAGVVCPLTTLEMWLRKQAGQVTYSGSFIAHWLDKLLYYDLPNWVFTLTYTSFACLVLASWFWIRPRALFRLKDN